MLPPKSQATLKDLQNHISQIGKERGWNKNSYLEIFLLFSEEIGELAKAIRNHEGLYAEQERKDKRFELEEEFADVFNYLLDLANYFEVDLEDAFRKKDAVNAKRIWNNKDK